PGLPNVPNDPNAFIDVFTDIDPLFVINNESGWYEGWMIHDLTVPNIAPPRSDGTGAATFGAITTADADALKVMGTGNNVPGNIGSSGFSVGKGPGPHSGSRSRS